MITMIIENKIYLHKFTGKSYVAIANVRVKLNGWKAGVLYKPLGENVLYVDLARNFEKVCEPVADAVN